MNSNLQYPAFDPDTRDGVLVFLDHQKKLISVGKILNFEYMEQCRIAQIQGFITREEMQERFDNIPFNPF